MSCWPDRPWEKKQGQEGGKEKNGVEDTSSGVHECHAEADLLSVVVPGALGSVTEDVVQHIGGVEDIQLAAPPVAVMCQAVLGHLHMCCNPVDAAREGEAGYEERGRGRTKERTREGALGTGV